jgi:hypothetical protein
MLVGLTRVREHCTFTWRKPETGGERMVEIRADHCLECIAELRRRGCHLINPDGSPHPS